MKFVLSGSNLVNLFVNVSATLVLSLILQCECWCNTKASWVFFSEIIASWFCSEGFSFAACI